jgi:hypothetical protein
MFMTWIGHSDEWTHQRVCCTIGNALFWQLDKGAWIMVNILQAYMIWFHIVGDYKHFNTLLNLVYRLVSFMAQLVHVLAGFNRWDEQQIYGTAVTTKMGLQWIVIRSRSGEIQP